jgi:hypothetical protein
MKRLNWTTAVAGAFCVLVATSAARAQTAEPAPAAPAAEAPAADAPAAAAPAVKKMKAKPKASAPSAASVIVINSRTAGLVELQAAASGSDKMKKVAGPLKTGQKVAARIPRGKDCLVDLKGTFDDGQSMDATGVDVCAQKTLNLTD